MPRSVHTTLAAAQEVWRVYLIPLGFALGTLLLTALLYEQFEAVLEVLAPALVLACVLAVGAGVMQLHLSTRRRRKRARGYREVERTLAELAAGNADPAAADIGRSSHTMEAARSMAAPRPAAERARIREGLVESGAWRAVVRRASSSSRKWERVQALRHLGWLGAEESAGIVYRRLADPDDDVAWAAAAALGGMTDDLAYETLLELLDDGRFPPSRVAQVLDASRHPQPVALLASRVRAGGSATHLFWVAYLLGRLDDPLTLDPLLDLSGHPDADVRTAAAEGLGRLGRPEGLKALSRLARDDEWFVRSHACHALGEPGLSESPEAARILRQAQGDSNWWVRRSAVDALERIEGDRP